MEDTFIEIAVGSHQSSSIPHEAIAFLFTFPYNFNFIKYDYPSYGERHLTLEAVAFMAFLFIIGRSIEIFIQSANTKCQLNPKSCDGMKLKMI